MKKVSSLLELILVRGTTKLNVLDGLGFLHLELFQPAWLVAVYSVVQLLQHAEEGTWWGSDQ